MAEKYPEFYIRKRQKEETYRRIVQIVVGFAVLLVVGGIVGFFIYKYALPNRQAAPKVQELADERQELATQNALASAVGQNEGVSDNDTQQPPGGEVVANLSDIPYDPSFPAVHVGVEGSNTSMALSGDQGEEAAEAESGGEDAADAGANSTPPSQQEQSESFERPSESESTAQKPEDKPASGNTGEKPKETKPTDSGSDQAAKPPAPPQDSAENTNKGTEDSGSGNVVYSVYAGTYKTREDAEKVKGDLQALGFQGTIVDMEIEFHVRVATLDDYARAEAIRQKLIDSGFPTAFATRRRS